MPYTEFFCQNGGSNLNAGSTTNNTAAYTSIHGNWVSLTRAFTPTDGSTPASTVSVGDWASVYIDGATVGVFVGRISVVGAGTNGTISISAALAGAAPADQTGTATIKVGGAWQGPNAASAFPFSLAGLQALLDSSNHQTRVNMKNDQTYSITSALTFAAANGPFVIQGYTSSTGDGGKATWSGGTSTGAIIANTVGTGLAFIDHIFTTSITTGTTVDLVISGGPANSWTRCVFTGARQKGLSCTGIQNTVTECEAYLNNVNNNATIGAFHTSTETSYKNCIAHDNAGSNTSGFVNTSALRGRYDNCISETNGAHGLLVTASALGGIFVENCDFYNNTGDGINVATAVKPFMWIENCNFFKNAKGIDNVSVINAGFAYNNTYGAGTQANTGADVTNNLTVSGTTNYTSNLTPWVDPANGNFSQSPNQGIIGRGAFTETAANYAGTVGYPFTGAAPAQIVPEYRIPSIASI